MARVSKEYYELKRAAIVEAAMNVCKRKTVSSVTMQDIIDEVGFSQGAIYRYYKNIDEILTDLLSRIVTELYEPVDRLNALIDRRTSEVRALRTSSGDAASKEVRRRLIAKIIKELHAIFVEEMEEFLYPHRKILMEFTILADNYPERARVIFPNAKPSRTIDGRIVEELRREIEDGVITPRIPLEEFIEYNTVVYGGMIKRAIAISCYQRNAFNNDHFVYDFKKRFNTFAMSSAFFLGLEDYFSE